MVQRQEQRWDDATALEELRTTDMVTFHGYGFADIKPPSTLAYEYLLDAGQRVDRDVYELLSTATPAGKVFAAHLLTARDPTYGASVWRWLAGQPGELHTGSGCVVSTRTLADYAREQLSRTTPPAAGPAPRY